MSIAYWAISGLLSTGALSVCIRTSDDRPGFDSPVCRISGDGDRREHAFLCGSRKRPYVGPGAPAARADGRHDLYDFAISAAERRVPSLPIMTTPSRR